MYRSWASGYGLRLSPLESGEVRFDLVVRGVFLFDLIIDAGYFLGHCQHPTTEAFGRYHVMRRRLYLVQCAYYLGERFVCAVFDFVPMEGLEILFRRF